MKMCSLLPPIDALQSFLHKAWLKFLVLLIHYLLMTPCWLSLFKYIFSSVFDETVFSYSRICPEFLFKKIKLIRFFFF